jgi:vacuolar-type H+-ATPase subunit I/STV1
MSGLHSRHMVWQVGGVQKNNCFVFHTYQSIKGLLMVAAAKAEDPEYMSAELRDLQRTVKELRSQLELACVRCEDMVREATRDAEREIDQLKDTIISLRDALKHAQVDKDIALRAAETSAAKEIEQLKAIASALREQLEQGRFDKDNALRMQQLETEGEIRQLREMIAAMRNGAGHH